VKALSQGLLRDQLIELRHDLLVAPGGKVGVDRELDRAQVDLLEPGDLQTGERLGGDVDERGTVP
jgi:hypothetical protein